MLLRLHDKNRSKPATPARLKFYESGPKTDTAKEGPGSQKISLPGPKHSYNCTLLIAHFPKPEPVSMASEPEVGDGGHGFPFFRRGEGEIERVLPFEGRHTG